MSAVLKKYDPESGDDCKETGQVFISILRLRRTTSGPRVRNLKVKQRTRRTKRPFGFSLRETCTSV